jgi:hypothetical protein
MRSLPFVTVALVGCGSSAAPPDAAPAVALAIVAPPEATGDVQVATVNGRPVWGSCVAHQAKAKDAALADCVAFELLAQAAEAKGLARDPGVVEATRTAMVSRLVATAFEARYRTVADLGGAMDMAIERRLFLMHQPELRTSTYARLPLPPQATPAEEATARAVAEQLAAGLRDETGLLGVNLVEAVAKVETQAKVRFEHADMPLNERNAFVREYGDALWSIPDIGRITGPVRTKWGWDVILWTGGMPAHERTRAELADELFPELRRQFFALWVESIRKALGLAVVVNAKQLEDGAAP